MKRTSFALVTVALCAVIVQPLRVEATGPDPNLTAILYRTSLVQAMDQCLVTSTNLGGIGACAPSNTNTTDGSQFLSGRVTIGGRITQRQITTSMRSRAAVPPFGLAGKTVHTVIMLRVTRTTGSPLVTWVDQTLDCPSVVVPFSGRYTQRVPTSSCGLNSLLAGNTTNKEILSVQVIDDSSGKVIAVPGIRKKF